MIRKFKNSKIGVKLIDDEIEFENAIIEHIKKYRYRCIEKNPKEYEMDKIIGKQIVNHLHEFFYISKKTKTIKNRHKNKNKTLKKHV